MKNKPPNDVYTVSKSGISFVFELGKRAVIKFKDTRGKKSRVLGKLTFEKGELIWRRPSHKSIGCNILYRESWDETVAQKKRRMAAKMKGMSKK